MSPKKIKKINQQTEDVVSKKLGIDNLWLIIFGRSYNKWFIKEILNQIIWNSAVAYSLLNDKMCLLCFSWHKHFNSLIKKSFKHKKHPSCKNPELVFHHLNAYRHLCSSFSVYLYKIWVCVVQKMMKKCQILFSKCLILSRPTTPNLNVFRSIYNTYEIRKYSHSKNWKMSP